MKLATNGNETAVRDRKLAGNASETAVVDRDSRSKLSANTAETVVRD
jgi:hypothetical protein